MDSLTRKYYKGFVIWGLKSCLKYVGLIENPPHLLFLLLRLPCHENFEDLEVFQPEL